MAQHVRAPLAPPLAAALPAAAAAPAQRSTRQPASMADDLPVARQFDLLGHGKAVVAAEADHSGSRLVAGGNDYMCHLWDFGGLKADGKSFRSFEVHDGYPVVAVSGCEGWAWDESGGTGCVPGLRASLPARRPAGASPCAGASRRSPAHLLQVSWSPTGDAFLVVTSYSQVGWWCVCGGGGVGGGGGAGVEQASAVLSFGPAPLEVLTALMDNVGAGAGGAEPIAVVGCSPTWRATTVAPPTAGSPLQRKAVQPRRQAPAGAACSPPPVLCSSFSRLLVLAVPRSSPQPKVFNRDGKELGELPKGDMYIRDLKNTKGA